MGVPTAPYYDDIRLGGSHGLRYPLEAGPATFAISKQVDLGSVSGTVTLTSQQALASLITANPSAALTLVFPGCFPGHTAKILNLSGTYTITAEVSGNAVNTVTVGTSSASFVTHNSLTGGLI